MEGAVMHEHEQVEVRSSYEGEWTRGFDVVEERASGYRLRRASDGTVLPGEFATADVRPET
jgi:hypothetical protein